MSESMPVAHPDVTALATAATGAVSALADIARRSSHHAAQFGQIFQITPVPGICTSTASAGFLTPVSGSERPKSRTAA